MNSGDQFHPPPPNDFEAFFEMYYAECRARIPGIQAIAAKWKFEDLLPGMSDFDTRFIMQDGMTVQDWCDMSTAVGDVHLDLCQRYPHWARNLEHLPGINLTWSEVTDAVSYYPEYPQWTFYRTEQPDRLAALEQYLADRPWDEKDEYFHLSKFCLYYGRYDRKIDPPVNLGPFESKYPLHSRFMHYFCPPLQSALSILTKRPVRGKMEAVRLAREMFPDQNIFVEMLDVVERHYAVPELYKEPQLTDLEDRLEEALLFLRDTLSQSITLIPGAHDKSMDEWKASLKEVMISPLMRAFGAARFSRLMKGRLRFYAAAPSHFDSTWPIRNELMRLKTNFFDTPARVYCEITTGTSPEDPTIILPWIYPGILDDEEFRCTEEFIRLLSDNYETGDQRRTASAIADVFDGFYSAQDKIIAAIREQSEKKAEPCT
jgi:hypothetical protein